MKAIFAENMRLAYFYIKKRKFFPNQCKIITNPLDVNGLIVGTRDCATVGDFRKNISVSDAYDICILKAIEKDIAEGLEPMLPHKLKGI